MKIVCKICVLIWLVFFAFELFAQTETDITVPELEKHIYFLTSDSLKGCKPSQTISVDVMRYSERKVLVVVL